MNAESLRCLYQRENWRLLLNDLFGSNFKPFSRVDDLQVENQTAKSAVQLGEIHLASGDVLAVYEVELQDNIQVERNKVAIRNLLRTYWNKYDGAFIASFKKNENVWRFSFVSETRQYDDEGNYGKVATATKRFTYVLGQGESIRTATERFNVLAATDRNTTLEDIKGAFNVEKMSKDFFDNYKKQYELFCEYMLSKTGIRQAIFNGDEKAIRDFNKKLLGRIVFLYFIQKKGWLGVPTDGNWGDGDINFLTNLFKKYEHSELFYSNILTVLFFDTLNKKRTDDLVELIKGEKYKIPFLNGGLFEEQNKKYREIIFPKEQFHNLFEFFNQYNFTIYEDDPNDHTVAVDPEMLGHIFENLLEDNKDKGAFYTPKEIVHYMCQESLIEYLCTALQIEDEAKERKAITKLIKTKEIDAILKPEIQNINKALDKVKICDPAIGSGAFPMGLLHEIFAVKLTLYIFENSSSEGFDAAAVKLNIIQNSIYGVDIEPGAVDIARLRFWLSLIVDEPTPKALPNLDYKIVVGDSLVSKLRIGNEEQVIDINWDLKLNFGKAEQYNQKLKIALDTLSEKQKQFFTAEQKEELKHEIRNLKIEILINQLSFNKELYANKNVIKTDMGFGLKPAEIKANLEISLTLEGYNNSIRKLGKLKNQPDMPLYFFDWKLDFSEIMNEQVTEKVGFDIVIGNPPYVNIEKIDKTIKDNISKFKTAYQKYDLYVLFYEIALGILEKNGLLSFITSNKFLSQGYGLKLRQEFLLYKIEQIINFNYDIFESATVRTCIVQIAKTPPSKTHSIQVIDVNNINDKDKFSNKIIVKVPQKTFDETEDNNFRINLTQQKIEILEKIEKETVQLYSICSVNYGLRPSSETLGLKKEAFIYDTKIKDKFKAYFEGKDMGYWLVNSNSYLDYQPNSMYNAMFPELFENEKLVGIRTLSDITKLRFIYDKKGFYCNDSVVVITLWYKLKNVEYSTIKRTITNENISTSKKYSYHYLQGILNSKIVKFYVNELMYDGTHFYPNHMKVIPIKKCDTTVQNKFKTIVETIHQLKSENKDFNTCTFEQQIDNLVYKLYNLTYDEVKVVDPDFGLSEKEYEQFQIE